MNFRSPMILRSHLPPLFFRMEHVSERPSRAYQESAKVVTTLNNPTLPTWAPSGTRSTSQKPSPTQPTTPNHSQLYKRARFFDPKLGRFVGRDPLTYIDGLSMYRGYFVPGKLDYSGLDVLAAVKRCEEVRKKKKKQDQEPDPVPICDSCKSKCDETVKEILEKAVEGDDHDKGLRDILDQFNKRCPRPKIYCETCKEGWGGFYRPHYITLCWNTYCADENNSRITTVLIHELTHALQRCGRHGRRNCEWDIKMEIEAYKCANQCTDFNSCLHAALGSACAQVCQPTDISNLYGPISDWFNDRLEKGKLCKFPRDGDYPELAAPPGSRF